MTPTISTARQKTGWAAKTRSPAELEAAAKERQRTSDQILESDARKKLVVAGPGTGKTHNFRRVLKDAGGGLALTFIRALSRELERDLGDYAQVGQGRRQA